MPSNSEILSAMCATPHQRVPSSTRKSAGTRRKVWGTAVLTFWRRRQEFVDLTVAAPRKCLSSIRRRRWKRVCSVTQSGSSHRRPSTHSASPPITHQCAFTQSRHTANSSPSCPSARLVAPLTFTQTRRCFGVVRVFHLFHWAFGRSGSGNSRLT